MYELKMKKLDPNYPSIHGHAWLNIWIVKHAFDVTGIDFHLEIPDPNEIEPVGLKGAPKAVNFNLSLRITQFPIVPSDRAKITGVPLAVSSKLQEYKASCNAQ